MIKFQVSVTQNNHNQSTIIILINKQLTSILTSMEVNILYGYEIIVGKFFSPYVTNYMCR